MIQRRWLMVTAILLIWLCSLACAYTKTFTPSEHVGTWRADYTGTENFDIKLTGVETLTLRADGTYQQIYDDGRGYVYASLWNKWYVKPKERLLYLESGRLYPLGVKEAERRARNPRGAALCTYPPYSSMDKNIEIDCTDAVLYILSEPSAQGGLILVYPEVGDPDDPEYVKFYLVATPMPAVTR